MVGAGTGGGYGGGGGGRDPRAKMLMAPLRCAETDELSLRLQLAAIGLCCPLFVAPPAAGHAFQQDSVAARLHAKGEAVGGI